MGLLGYWVERGYVIGRGVGFCWLRDVPWDGLCCDWFLTVGFVVGWSGFGFWFRVGL